MQQSCPVFLRLEVFLSVLWSPCVVRNFLRGISLKMDHITVFPRPAAPELPPHRLRSCQDCRTFPESQWMLSIGCFLFCILRDDRTIRAIPFGRSALLHCAITFFLPFPLPVPERQACRTSVRWDRGVFPGVGSVFCIHSSSYVRFSGENLPRCMYSRSHTGTANRFSVFPESSLFQLPRDFRIVLRSYIFSFKKAVHDIMCIMSWTAYLRWSCIVLTWNLHAFYAS